jgi:UDP-N-acetylglucosamine--N-acetylmuramyl-(pentapeptide) pyrophosphoryl-undecaprenol N-acetylglucosamine transferase
MYRRRGVIAWLRRVPRLVYLPDIVPGWSVRLLAIVADNVAVTHRDSQLHLPAGKVVVTGYPVRATIGAWSKADARQHLGLPADGLVLLVWGGSRGARSINRVVLRELEELTALATVVHITGADWVAEAQERRSELDSSRQHRYRVYPYLHDEFRQRSRCRSRRIARWRFSPWRISSGWPAERARAIPRPRSAARNAQALVEGLRGHDRRRCP